MYQSTDAFKNLVLQDSRTFKSKITYGDVTITNAKSIKLTGGSEGEDDFSLGSTVSQYITVTLPDPGKAIEGNELLVQIGMDVGGTVEYIPMGYFTAGKPQKDEEQIEFTAYDRMLKLETPFSMDGSSTDSVSVLKKIQEITGVPVVTANLPIASMSVPKGYSCREVLAYIAQLYGCFAICNRSGRIELHKYVDSGYKVGTGRYWDTFEHNDYSFTVEKLTCFTGQDKDRKDISISSGSGTRAVTFSNPFMTQAILDDVMKKMSDFSYMPGSLRMLGDPRLDPWDAITVEDRNGKSYKVPLMKLEWEYDGGFTDSVEAVGLSEEETNANYKGPSTKEMERYYAQLVMIDQAMINKLDVDTARITYATITNLNAVNASVQKLEVEVGNFKQLTATDFSAVNAKIGILENDYGNIKVLLSGSAGIGDLQNIHLTTKNAVIDSALIKSAVIQTVTVGDLLSGTISTNKFIIAADDGGIKIQGATQQWSDSNGTIRMQAGRDKNGDFTFCLFDKTGKGVLIDSTGIKPDAIADGLIVDSMVGDAANINAKKLDINSMFSVINGSTQTIKSSRIWMDEKNQSLNQVYSAITSDATETKKQVATISSGLSGLRAEFSQTNSDNQGRFQGLTTSISVIQGNISALISDSEIKELKNGKVTMYSKLASAELNISGLQVNFSDLSTKYDTVSGQYTSLNSKVASYKTSLDGLSADLTSVSTNLKNNYSTTTAMNSAIKVAIDGVTSSVSTKINSIQVGGRNLVRNSYKLNGQWSGAGGFTGTTTVVGDADALCQYHIETKCTVAGSGPHYPVFSKKSTYIGKTYTWSFEAKCSVSKTGNVGHECGGQTQIALTTSWKKFSHTWTFTDGQYSSFTFYMQFKVGEILYIRDFKIEEGTKATSWNPAPEDVDASITAVDGKFASYSTTTQMNSAIKQATDSITSTVSKTYVTTTTYNSGIADVKADSTTKANNALASAKKDATTKADNALASAKTDATTKANAAEANAKADTAEKLKSYSTTAQMNSAINQKADSITSTVAATYVTTTTYSSGIADAKADATTKANNALDSAKKDATTKANTAETNAKADTAEKLKSYSTTTQMNSAINQKADSITSTVSSTYATKTALSTTDSKVTALETWKSEASLKITDSAIVSTVTKSTSWSNKADKASIISQINQSAEKLTISASKISLTGVVTANSYFKILTDGSMQATSGKIGGWTIKSTSITSADGSLILDAKNNKICTGASSSYTGTEITKNSVTTASVTCTKMDCTYGNFGDGGNYFTINDSFSGSGGATLCLIGKFLATNSAVKLYSLSHVTSGGHIVFASDGATLAYLSSSSKRYKNHVRNLEEDDIAGLYEIPTVYFTYKPGYLEEDSDIPIPGLYAEDVEQYLPFAARYQGGKIEDWNERMIIPYLIKAIQECHREIAELKRKAG